MTGAIQKQGVGTDWSYSGHIITIGGLVGANKLNIILYHITPKLSVKDISPPVKIPYFIISFKVVFSLKALF